MFAESALAVLIGSDSVNHHKVSLRGNLSDCMLSSVMSCQCPIISCEQIHPWEISEFCLKKHSFLPLRKINLYSNKQQQGSVKEKNKIKDLSPKASYNPTQFRHSSSPLSSCPRTDDLSLLFLSVSVYLSVSFWEGQQYDFYKRTLHFSTDYWFCPSVTLSVFVRRVILTEDKHRHLSVSVSVSVQLTH